VRRMHDHQGSTTGEERGTHPFEELALPYQRYKAAVRSRRSCSSATTTSRCSRLQQAEQANAYLTTGLFTSDVVGALKPLLDLAPDVRIYKAA
jgi:hypothetical protein